MKRPHLCFAIAGICLGAAPRGLGQPVSHECSPATTVNCSEYRGRGEDSSSTAPVRPHRKKRFTDGVQVTGGQLTIPFKIRPKAEHSTFRLTTDVTLGAYIGLSKRISEKKEYFMTVPLTAGLTFINISEDNTSLDLAMESGDSADVVPGLSWSSGIILQLESYNFGLIFGKDYAGEIGNQWMYHRKWWWSFGIGFSFVGN